MSKSIKKTLFNSVFSDIKTLFGERSQYASPLLCSALKIAANRIRMLYLYNKPPEDKYHSARLFFSVPSFSDDKGIIPDANSDI